MSLTWNRSSVLLARPQPAILPSLAQREYSSNEMLSETAFAKDFGDVGGKVPTAARQGRHRQRYGTNGERLVAG